MKRLLWDQAVTRYFLLCLLLTPAVALSYMSGANDALPVESRHNQEVCRKIIAKGQLNAYRNPCKLPPLSVIRGV